jgi:hypothetical protein
MSLRKPTAGENEALKGLQEKCPLKVERYLDVDTVLVLELPCIMLGIDREECKKKENYDFNGVLEDSLIEEAEKIINDAVLSKKLELQKREIVGFKRNPIRYEYAPYFLPQSKGKVDIHPDNIDALLALISLPHNVIYKLFRIIDVINWLDKEKAIDPGFPLSLPEELVKRHKMKHEQSELVQYKLDSYAKNESAKARADKLECKNSELEAENKELKEEKDLLVEELSNKPTNTTHNLICCYVEDFLNNNYSECNESSGTTTTKIITDSANKFFGSKLKKLLTQDTVSGILAIAGKKSSYHRKGRF